jgi:sirohydrochlorin ferrochelatase
VVIAPWFLAPGRLPDRVRGFAHDEGIAMAEPLGAHSLVAETVLDRYEQALKARAERIAA